MRNVALEVKIKTLEMTGMYEKVWQVFFNAYYEVCFIDIVLHGERRRCRALCDDVSGMLFIQGVVGTFPLSDLVWPADVMIYPDGGLLVKYGPSMYDVGEVDPARLRYK